jgi:hypothetical protein
MKTQKYMNEQMAKVSVIRPLKAFEVENEVTKRSQSHRDKCKKVRFRDQQEAIEVLHTIERFKKFAGAEGKDISLRNERRTYLCERCKGVHLTSQPSSWTLEYFYAA